jgi:hypothetical protein
VRITLLTLSASCLSNSAHCRNVDSHDWAPDRRDPEHRMKFATVLDWRAQRLHVFENWLGRSMSVTATLQQQPLRDTTKSVTFH